ncbi:MAG TPA: NAD-dependent epimerase/dehydratase family protein [Chthoniobacterales bacterium]|nr:NAD-dependent epimerase/dehydratase family protein [Chthoniobacterales bacterium]
MPNDKPSIALFGGSGTLGQALAPLFGTQPFRVVGRSFTQLRSAFTTYPAADFAVWDPQKPETIRVALEGIRTLVYLVGVPYTDFRLHPVLFEQVLTAAIEQGVERCALVGTVYPFGLAQTSLVREDHPRSPQTFKGQMRKQQEDILLAADAAGRIRGTILRLPDFYGPNVDRSYLSSLFQAAAQQKTAQLIGPLTTPHDYVYIPDAARILFRLIEEDGAYGHTWNLAGSGKITLAEVVKLVESITGKPVRKFVAGKRMLQLVGLFDPLLKEVAEMHYLFTQPLFLDDSALTNLLGPLNKTSYQEGVRASLVAARRN